MDTVASPHSVCNLVLGLSLLGGTDSGGEPLELTQP